LDKKTRRRKEETMKKFMKRNRVTAVFLCLALLTLTACGSGNGNSETTEKSSTTQQSMETTVDTADDLPELTMIIAHNGSEDSINQYACEVIKELFEEKSGGKIKIDIYGGGTLGTERDCLKSVLNGDITFTVGASAATMSVIPEMAVFDIPFLFKNLADARTAVDDKDFRSLLNAACEEEGYKLALLADQGFRVLSSDKKIETVADLKGFNLRTMENQNHVGFWNMLGVNATPMTQSEVYLSLQQKMLNGQENPYNVIYAFNFQEVQSYIIETNHIYYAMTIMASEEYYESLPAEYQTMYEEVFAETTTRVREKTDETAEYYLNLLLDAGMEQVILSDEVLAEMAETTLPIIDSISEKIGKDLVDSLVKNASK